MADIGVQQLCQSAPLRAIGYAVHLTIRKHDLRPDITEEILRYLNGINHTGWYCQLIVSSGCDEHEAFELCIAMHLDMGLEFDYESCIYTPDSL